MQRIADQIRQEILEKKKEKGINDAETIKIAKRIREALSVTKEITRKESILLFQLLPH